MSDFILFGLLNETAVNVEQLYLDFFYLFVKKQNWKQKCLLKDKFSADIHAPLGGSVIVSEKHISPSI